MASLVQDPGRGNPSAGESAGDKNDRRRGACFHRVLSSSGRVGLLWRLGCSMKEGLCSWTSQESSHWGHQLASRSRCLLFHVFVSPIPGLHLQYTPFHESGQALQGMLHLRNDCALRARKNKGFGTIQHLSTQSLRLDPFYGNSTSLYRKASIMQWKV